MTLRLVQIAMNARDDSAVGRFWAEALGWSVSSEEPGVTNVEPVGFAYPDPVAVCIDVLAVPEPKTVKNRVHIDLATTSAAHQADLVARLQDLGATLADVGQGDVSWTVLADPEGNEFCVLAPWPGGRDTGPVAAVTVDCADPRAMARFWDEAMDWTLHQVTGDHAVLRSAKGVGPYLEFLRAPGVKTVKNRIHLDLRPYPGDDPATEVARLRALGATPADVGQGDVPWTVLADPEGNEFCVLEPRETYRDTGPIAAVVVDCADPRAMARFWGEAVDWTLHEVDDDHATFRSSKGVGPYLEFLRTPGGKTAPDRVHLDLLPYPGDDNAAEVARLRALGATDLDVGQGDVEWTCLTDPEGHEFCVLALS